MSKRIELENVFSTAAALQMNTKLEILNSSDLAYAYGLIARRASSLRRRRIIIDGVILDRSDLRAIIGHKKKRHVVENSESLL